MKQIFFYYMPMYGSFSYMALSLKSIGPESTNSNESSDDGVLLSVFSTYIGFALYIYSRSHLKAVTTMKKVAYSVVGSIMFMMGSFIMVQAARGALPEATSAVVGFVSGAMLLKLGHDYLKNSDKLVERIGSKIPNTDTLI